MGNKNIFVVRSSHRISFSWRIRFLIYPFRSHSHSTRLDAPHISVSRSSRSFSFSFQHGGCLLRQAPNPYLLRSLPLRPLDLQPAGVPKTRQPFSAFLRPPISQEEQEMGVQDPSLQVPLRWFFI